MPDFTRTDRLSEQVKHDLYDIIRNLKDPRIPQMFSVTFARVTQDLRHARVGISVIGDEQVQNGCMKALRGAAGHIRRELGARLGARYTPELSFELDRSIEYSVHIGKVLSDIGLTQGEEQAEADADGSDDGNV